MLFLTKFFFGWGYFLGEIFVNAKICRIFVFLKAYRNMETLEIIRNVNRLPLSQQMLIAERIIHSIRERAIAIEVGSRAVICGLYD